MCSITKKDILCLLFVANIILPYSYAVILSTDNIENRMVKRPIETPTSQSSGSSPFDDNSENLRKNDDSHLRLYYKSNSPGRSVSHELEHRYVKNPNYQINQRMHQEANNYAQPKLNNQFDLNYFDPRNSLMSNYPTNQVYNQYQNMFFDPNKNKQTMLNLHYHGNSLDGLESAFAGQQQTDLLNNNNNIQNQQQKNFKANLLRMLLLNMSPNQQQQQQQMLPQQLQQQQVYMQTPQMSQQQLPQFDQSNNENGLQYKIVHLKFKVEPQYGRVLGQGIVETDNGAGSVLNAKRFSLMPREIPELIKRLLNSAQSQPQQSLMSNLIGNLPRNSGLIKKREDSYEEEPRKSEDLEEDSSLAKRQEQNDSDQNESSETSNANSYESTTSKKRNKKTVSFGETSSLKSDDEDKINDSELTESFKSLQRRDDIDSEISSLSDNNDSDSEKQMLLRNDDEQPLEDSVSSLNDSSEYN